MRRAQGSPGAATCPEGPETPNTGRPGLSGCCTAGFPAGGPEAQRGQQVPGLQGWASSTHQALPSPRVEQAGATNCSESPLPCRVAPAQEDRPARGWNCRHGLDCRGRKPPPKQSRARPDRRVGESRLRNERCWWWRHVLGRGRPWSGAAFPGHTRDWARGDWAGSGRVAPAWGWEAPPRAVVGTLGTQPAGGRGAEGPWLLAAGCGGIVEISPQPSSPAQAP